jgi:hypothetical protein
MAGWDAGRGARSLEARDDENTPAKRSNDCGETKADNAEEKEGVPLEGETWLESGRRN